MRPRRELSRSVLKSSVSSYWWAQLKFLRENIDELLLTVAVERFQAFQIFLVELREFPLSDVAIVVFVEHHEEQQAPNIDGPVENAC